MTSAAGGFSPAAMLAGGALRALPTPKWRLIGSPSSFATSQSSSTRDRPDRLHRSGQASSTKPFRPELVDAAPHLVARVLDAGARNPADADEPVGGVGAELGDPVVVGLAHARRRSASSTCLIASHRYG